MPAMSIKETKPLSIIEALSGGFELILQNPWIVLLPVVLDLWVWQGPQITLKPLFDRLITFLQTNIAPTPGISPEMAQNTDLVVTALKSAGESFNLFGVIATGLPTLFWIEPPMIGSARAVVLILSDGVVLLAWLGLLTLLALFLTALFMELIGRVVRKETDAKTFLPRLAVGFGTTTLLAILLFGATVGLALPLSLGVTLVSLFNQGIASLILLVGMLIVLWATLYLAFVLPSIFVSRSNAWQAILNSISIFRFDFWSAMGIVMLTYLIRWGFAFVWELFLDNPGGILFVVIANAFLGSGLTAAMMVFYADRINWLNHLRERIRQQQAQLKGQ
jgi:hypothetical protein